MQGSGRSGAEGRAQSVNCYKCFRVSCICRARPSEMDVGSQGGVDEADDDDSFWEARGMVSSGGDGGIYSSRSQSEPKVFSVSNVVKSLTLVFF